MKRIYVILIILLISSTCWGQMTFELDTVFVPVDSFRIIHDDYISNTIWYDIRYDTTWNYSMYIDTSYGGLNLVVYDITDTAEVWNFVPTDTALIIYHIFYQPDSYWWISGIQATVSKPEYNNIYPTLCDTFYIPYRRKK